jgi:hypothetical protein
VLQALVRKTERIREQLGSAGEVVGQRLAERLEREGIRRAQTLAREIENASDERLRQVAIEEMDDETAARRPAGEGTRRIAKASRGFTRAGRCRA